MRAALGIFVIIFICGFLAFEYYAYNFYLSFVPHELGVSKIQYRKEERWGFGPGGNATGIRVYQLPDNIANDIQNQGIGYFYKLSSSTKNKIDSREHYKNWLETPIQTTKHWTNYMSLSDDADYSIETPSINHYMGAYGFHIKINPAVEKMVNDAITKSGSYYAYGRSGVIIIIPEQRKIVYAYNG